jgi:hypothetical protein
MLFDKTLPEQAWIALIRNPPIAREAVRRQGDFIAANVMAIKLHNETAPGHSIRSHIEPN